MLLIMEYWTNGGLPDDDKRLARIAGLTIEEWEGVRPSIEELFQPGWKHRRIDKELKRASGKSEAAKVAAELRWEREREAKAMRTHNIGSADADANAMLPEPQPYIEPKDSGSSPSLLVASPPAPRKAKRAKARTQIAEDAQPTERDCKAAEEAGLSLDAFRSEWRHFRDHHRAKGSLMADWSAAWRTWLSGMPKFQLARAGPAPKQSTVNDPILAAAARRLAQSCHGTPQASDYPEPAEPPGYDPSSYDGPGTIDAQAIR
ncbi:DUF1376 domain-containing protein [Methylocystis sp. S23]